MCLVAAAGSDARAQVLLGVDGGAGGQLSRLHKIDPATGNVVETVGQVFFAITGMAVHPQTQVVYASTSNLDPRFPGFLIRIDLRTGRGIPIGPVLGTGEAAADLAFAADGTLYGWISQAKWSLVTIDPTTGAGTLIGSAPLGRTKGNGLAMSAAGTLYLSGNGDDRELTVIDPNTGDGSSTISLTGGSGDSLPIGALAFDDSGTLFGLRKNMCAPCSQSDLVTIDTATGAISVIRQNTPFALEALTFLPLVAVEIAVVRPRPHEVIRVGRRTPITVLILSGPNFDAALVDGSSLAFGPKGAGIIHLTGGHLKDVDGDGRADLLVHFRTDETGIACEQSSATLLGQTLGGAPISGSTEIIASGRNCF
jgi:hypothetical protein